MKAFTSPTASIRDRLTVMLVGISAITVLATGVAFMLVSGFSACLATVHELVYLARVTGLNCEASLAFSVPEDAVAILDTLSAKPSVRQAVLHDRNGRRVATYEKVLSIGGVGLGPPTTLFEGYAFVDGHVWVAHPIVRHGTMLGTLYLEDDLSVAKQSFLRDVVALAVVVVIVLLLACLLAKHLRRPIVEPILDLAARTHSAAGSLDGGQRARIKDTQDVAQTVEIQLLYDAFNTMLDRIQEREQALRSAHSELAIAHRDLEQRVEKRTAELAVSNRDLEEFAYVTSHDLQEPLRMVGSYLQVLRRRYRGQLDDDADRYIDYAVDGAHRMRRLINDLLSYSRVATRGEPIDDISLDGVLDDALANLEQAINESGARVTHGVLPHVHGDPVQLAQVFQNLISNAIKYSGGRTPNIHIIATETPAEWQIEVRDFGIGIDAEYFDRIFVIFERLDAGDRKAGTGIGLALCKRIVQRHGGRMMVFSEGTGKGATFTFTLPKKVDDM